MEYNKKLGIYLILIGVGIGIIIGTGINLLNPTVIYRDYTDEEIRSRAKELGMLDLKDNIEKNREESNKEDGYEEDSFYRDETITFEIKRGETSEEIIDNLFNAKIITNKKEFQDSVIDKNAAKKFKYGIYEIEKNTEHNTLIEILTK